MNLPGFEPLTLSMARLSDYDALDHLTTTARLGLFFIVFSLIDIHGYLLNEASFSLDHSG